MTTVAPLAVGVLAPTDNESRTVFGWAYVTHDEEGAVVIDKSGDFVDDYNEIENAAYAFVLESRVGGLEHIPGLSVMTLIESVVFTPTKCERLGIPAGTLPIGWFVGFYVHDDSTWESVKRGERLSFSVHGTGIRTPVKESA